MHFDAIFILFFKFTFRALLLDDLSYYLIEKKCELD